MARLAFSLCAGVAGLLALCFLPLGALAQPAGGADASMWVVDSRYVEVTASSGAKTYCWLELTGDALIRRYVLGEIRSDTYMLTKMGAEMPAPPMLTVRPAGPPPGADVPRWRIAAAAKVGEVLWLYVAPVPRPRVTVWIGMPPHPWRQRSGGDPYEGGVVRVDLAGGKAEGWTSENGLPDALVCHDGQDVTTASGDASWGPVVREIVAADGKIAFTTHYGSRVACDPAGQGWKVLQDGEPAVLAAILQQWKIDARAVWATRRAGVIRCREAVPHLVAALGGCHELGGREGDMAFAAKDALIAIGDASCAAELQRIAEGAHRTAANCATAAAQHLTVPFSEPVAGLSVRLIATEAFPLLGGGGNVEVQVKNTSDRPLAFYYNKHYANSPHLAGEIRSADGSVTEVRPGEDLFASREVLEPGQVVTIHRPIDPHPAGRYVVRYRIDIPEVAARDWQKADDKSPIKVWWGSIQTNEVALRWRGE